MAGIRTQFRFGALIIGSAFALYGCSSQEGTRQIELGQNFKTRLGQYHITPDKDFTFSISKIVEDSRGSCGKNNVCVWDGQLLVQLEYSQNPESETNDYRDVLQFREEGFEDYTVQILKAHPRRQPKNHEKYRFTIAVEQVDID